MCKRIVLAGLVLVLIHVIGCSQAERAPHLTGSSQRLPGVSLDQAFDAALQALRGPYQIDQIDRSDYMIRTVPVEFNRREATAQLSGQLLPGNNAFRKIVSVAVAPSLTRQTVVTVRVEIQRYDTNVVNAFAYQRQSSDLPADQSAQDVGPIPRERRQVWTVVRRDAAEEQKILGDIKALLTK